MDGQVEIHFHIECRCTHCGDWNRYHSLSSVHGAIKAMLNKERPDKEWKVPAKCNRCDKYFDITSFKAV